MPRTRCPNCSILIKFDKPREGTIFACHACGVELEITSTDPLKVDFADEWEDREGWTEWEEELVRF